MGRGTSNRTRLWNAFWELEALWNKTHPDQAPGKQTHELLRSLGRSTWFEHQFIEHLVQGESQFRAIRLKIGKEPGTKPKGLYILATQLRLSFKWKPNFAQAANMTTRQNGLLSKYYYLHLDNPESYSSELASRHQAQFYLILVQHFLGAGWAKELRTIYKKWQVKYRRVRQDQGVKLTGTDLAEFKLRLAGHQLLVPSEEQGD